MTEKTLIWVGDEPRTFEGKYGPLASIKVKFEDDSMGELTTKPDKVAERIAALKDLIGKPGEYGLEDRGKWDDGNPKPYKITDYPGKPQQQFSGGGRPRGRDPQEIRSIQRQTALKAAVELCSVRGDPSVTVDDALMVADQFIAWLEQPAAVPSPAPPSQEQSPFAAAQGGGRVTPPPETSTEVGSITGKDAAADVDRGRGADGPPSSTPFDHPGAHQFQPAPREGWLACSICGKAQKAKK